MTCNNCCPNVLKVTGISNTGGSYFLVVDGTISLRNGCKYVLVIPTNLMPTTTTVNQVYIANNGKNYPLVDKCIGNYVYTDQLRFIETNKCCNKVLRLVFGTSGNHFKIISQCLPKSSATPNA